MSCGVGCRCGSCCGSASCRLAATALIRPLAWEPPYAAGAAQEMAKRQKKKEKEKEKKKRKLQNKIIIKYHFIPLKQHKILI